MKIYILGICGTFMASLAVLAKEAGYEVAGCDENVYPPMSNVLENAGIQLTQGYRVQDMLDYNPDEVIIGNALSRGNEIIEYMLDNKLPRYSGPSWLEKRILKDKKVIAICGTHGKTTTTSMVCNMLEAAGLNPSFLIGGVSQNFGVSSRLTDSDYFVIEADEYDTSFFDKRAKLVHYFPHIVLINNLEFDHADIYPDMDAIIHQFHQMIRVMPQIGELIINESNDHTSDLLAKGIWSNVTELSKGWSVEFEATQQNYSLKNDKVQYDVPANILGKHNAKNALAAATVVSRCGVYFQDALESLKNFKGTKRRLELIHDEAIKVYDDFAHHPTAIKAVLETVRQIHPNNTIHAVIQFGSRSMQNGAHRGLLENSVLEADQIYCQEVDNENWSLTEEFKHIADKVNISLDTDSILKSVVSKAKQKDIIVIMRNSSFDEMDKKVKNALMQ